MREEGAKCCLPALSRWEEKGIQVSLEVTTCQDPGLVPFPCIPYEIFTVKKNGFTGSFAKWKEVQRGEATCLRSHSQSRAVLRSERRIWRSQSLQWSLMRGALQNHPGSIFDICVPSSLPARPTEPEAAG